LKETFNKFTDSHIDPATIDTDKPLVVMVQPIVGLLDNVKTEPAIPLSLITACTLLTKDYEILVVDQRLSKTWPNSLRAALRREPVCVGTTAMIGPQIEHALDAFRVVKSFDPTIPTVWGGPQGGIMPEITIAHPDIDFLIQGDAEYTFKNLVDSLARGVDPSWIPGVWTKDGTIDDPYKLVDLNEVPDPPYGIVKVTRYLPKRFGVPTIDVESSRGCPYSCKFCYNPFMHRRRWRALTVERTLSRIDMLVDRFNIDSVWFIDDEFFVDLKRSREIILGLKERFIRWTVQGTTIVNCLRMDDEFLRLLRDSGCRQLNIGVESGSEELLASMNKPITNEQVLEVNEKLRKFRIVPSFYFIVGFPHETEDDFRQTLRLVEKIFDQNPDAKIMNIGCYTPYPSTELLQDCLELGYEMPKTLEEYSYYGVDEINTPWVLNSPKRLKQVRGANFINYFLDNKINEVGVAPWIRIIGNAYRPLAQWRLRNQNFNIPIDITIGNAIKRKLG